MVDDVLDGFRPRVEGGDEGGDDGAHFERLVIVRRWPVCSGVSRTASTRRRRSFSTTSAARDISVGGDARRDLAPSCAPSMARSACRAS